MTSRRLLAALLLTGSLANAEPPTTMPSGVHVGGDVPTALTLAATDLAVMPHQSMSVKDHDGSTATYAGVPVRELLLKAGMPLGQHRLRGPLLAKAVVVTSADGYKVVFGLAEFDDEYAERDVILADRRNDEPLNGKTGPLRLVVPQEGMQGRWSRMVTDITVVDLKGK